MKFLLGLSQNPKPIQVVNLLTGCLLESHDQVLGVGDAVTMGLQIGAQFLRNQPLQPGRMRSLLSA